MTIYCYHSVDPGWRSPLAVSPAEFDAQCEWIASHTRVLPLEDAVSALDRAGRLPAGAAAITFDDGYAGCYGHAFPILRARRLPSTIFLVAETLTPAGRAIDWAGVDTPATGTLSADQVREMADAGVSFGSHSFSHHDLTTLSEAECERDLRASRDVLEDVLRRPVPLLAYPGGKHNDVVRRAAARAGFTHGFTLPDRREPRGPLSIPRVGVYPGNGPLALRVKTARWYLDARANPVFPALRNAARRLTRTGLRRARP